VANGTSSLVTARTSPSRSVAEQLELRRLATTDSRHFPAIAGDVALDLVPHPPQ